MASALDHCIDDLKIISSPVRKAIRSRQDLFRAIFTFIFNAVRRKKVYCIGRGFTCAKKYLQQRGWINVGKGVTNSKICIKRIETKLAVHHNLNTLRENAKAVLRSSFDFGKDKKGLFLALISNFVPNHIWITHRADVRWNYLKPDQTINRLPKVVFASKTGLNRILTEDPKVAATAESFYPRCYELTDAQTFDKFVEDYKFTACSAILRWFHEKSIACKVIFKISETEPVSLSSILEFCLWFCSRKLNQTQGVLTTVKEGNPLKPRLGKPSAEESDTKKMPLDWPAFFQFFYALTKKEFIEIVGLQVHQDLHERCKDVLEEIREKIPQSLIDGPKNVWIIKPGHSSQGKGINIRIKLEDILHKEYRKNLVVQKYIERPLLIYDTKFDIRQWFVISSWNPLTIWMSKVSYLRFCSQIFTYDSFHESIHLCNNAVQAKYANGTRSSKLPLENMWTSEEFIEFLRQKGLDEYWHSKIFPGMKFAIKECIMASKAVMQLSMRHRAFELFGADFLISQDFNPWLIEINSSPALGHSTSVTAQLVPACLKDVLALTTAVNPNPNAEYGSLVCIYSQAEEERKKSADSLRPKKLDEEQDKMMEYIDQMMSKPSYSLTHQDSKIDLVKDWIIKSSKEGRSRKKNGSRKDSGKRRRNPDKGHKKSKIQPILSSPTFRSKLSHQMLPNDDNFSFVNFEMGMIANGAQRKNNEVRKILKSIPVATDERVLFKYKCNHCI